MKALLEAKRVLKRRIKLSFAKFLKNMNLENFMKKKKDIPFIAILFFIVLLNLKKFF